MPKSQIREKKKGRMTGDRCVAHPKKSISFPEFFHNHRCRTDFTRQGWMELGEFHFQIGEGGVGVPNGFQDTQGHVFDNAGGLFHFFLYPAIDIGIIEAVVEKGVVAGFTPEITTHGKGE